ncbi:hemicentin-2-like [Oscarella lobularis]|uniref:hemicentin-2-like n=1 Tax=Oscarella lobularis TaxID=121494 RepID=UPI003313B97D
MHGGNGLWNPKSKQALRIGDCKAACDPVAAVALLRKRVEHGRPRLRTDGLAFLRNGVKVAASKQNAMSFEWRISNVQRSAAGLYRCRATNMAGTDTESVQLIVNYSPSVALSTGASIEFPVKESRTILCNTTGLPLARCLVDARRIEGTHSSEVSLLRRIGESRAR